MKLRRFATLAFVSAVLVACGGDDAPPVAPTYEYFVLGQAEAEVQTPAPTEPSVVIMGGGPDVDSAFRWMIERSGIRPGTGGRFVVIRASGTEPVLRVMVEAADVQLAETQVDLVLKALPTVLQKSA